MHLPPSPGHPTSPIRTPRNTEHHHHAHHDKSGCRAEGARRDGSRHRGLRGLLSVAAAVVLAFAGCSSGAVPPAGGATGVTRSLSVTVSGTTVKPAPTQVDLTVGDTLTLTVTTDRDDSLHAHGFTETELKAGQPSTVRLTAAETGVFEVETHEPELLLLTVAVR